MTCQLLDRRMAPSPPAVQRPVQTAAPSDLHIVVETVAEGAVQTPAALPSPPRHQRRARQLLAVVVVAVLSVEVFELQPYRPPSPPPLQQSEVGGCGGERLPSRHPWRPLLRCSVAWWPLEGRAFRSAG